MCVCLYIYIYIYIYNWYQNNLPQLKICIFLKEIEIFLKYFVYDVHDIYIHIYRERDREGEGEREIERERKKVGVKIICPNWFIF